ncbi:MAG: HlyD family efflux transporter periplasmic adaptor subunit [Verrucomicrobia bacterium]|nr:HlyD family efflux transporter periplasmic adaptor subunit [Verrucomicrobiota bacterium]
MNNKSIYVALTVLVTGVLLWKLLLGGSGEGREDLPVFETVRGDLVIHVLEGGNIRAMEYLEIKNEVNNRSNTKVLSIIEEGYEVTEQDVKDGKILIRLDSSEIEEEIVGFDVDFQQTEATYAEAKQNLEIQESESQSAIKLERQNMRFALLDFQKFVGQKASKEILSEVGLPYNNDTVGDYEEQATLKILSSFDSSKLTDKVVIKKEEEVLNEKGSQAAGVDFDAFLAKDKLSEGEAEQTMRRLKDESLVAKTEMSVVAQAVEGARRLRAKEFITKTTLENELVNLEKAKLKVQTTATELDLFRDYEYPKEAEKMLSTFEEALLELIREKREAMAKMAQMEARFRTAKRRYELQLKKRADLEKQLESCVIKATKTGLVAYGPAKQSRYSRDETVQAGAELRRGQTIITIPDMSKLAVDVDIHESHIKKIELGQMARITVDAVADRTLVGKVTKVAVLPDSNASRYNPSLKVYPTRIEIEGAHDWLMPGMTAKVEIVVSELKSVVYVPVQSIFFEEDEHYAFVVDGDKYERRQVDIGAHNDEFIEVKKGLDEGDAVLLKKPDGYDEPGGHKGKEKVSRTAGMDKRKDAKKKA